MWELYVVTIKCTDSRIGIGIGYRISEECMSRLHINRSKYYKYGVDDDDVVTLFCISRMNQKKN